MTIAITRAVPESIAHCELTHLARQPIDYAVASRQHAAYERALEALGCAIVRLPTLNDRPDSVFVEDVAIVVDELAILTHPGATTRREEVSSAKAALARFRPIASIEAPATIDGGDVLRIGRTIWVGLSSRTNRQAIDRLTTLLAPHGYEVRPVAVHGCLHLKSAVTALPDGAVLANPLAIDVSFFAEVVEIDSREPSAANVLTVGTTVLCAAAHPRTNERLAQRGYTLRTVDASELAKAEGALTCCSILIE